MIEAKLMSYHHLPLFSIYTLAQISDWLDEMGALFVDINLLRSAGGTGQYFVRSMQDLRLLILEYSYWPQLIFTIYREVPFSVCGIANKDLLKQALQEFPQGTQFHIVKFGHYPEPIRFLEEDNNQRVLLTLIEQEWGHSIAIGHGPLFWEEIIDSIPTVVTRNDGRQSQQLVYAPYDTDPARYQWIVDMWRE